MYNDEILKEFYSPENVGVIKGASAVGKIVSPVCGEIVKIYISVEENQIVDATFQVFGCPATIAGTSKVTKWLKGKTIEEANSLTEKEVWSFLGGSLPEMKEYIPSLIIDTVKDLVEDYRKSNK